QVRALSEQAKNEGHELIMHAPMEAIDSSVPLGPISLTSEMSHKAFQESFEQMADSFEGYVGVNNHMGSRLTQAPEHMAYLMEEIQKRNLYFLDSKTIHNSIAYQTAQNFGIPTIERDVFLDHEDTPEFVKSALRKVEKIAAARGNVVAIGHPKENTMTALKEWIPTLENRGFELVHLSEIIDFQPQNSDKLVYHINE
ncbi:MAG: divergent polysaccharide deacetylase family protein, partial [Pseudomonadota bacterium]